MSKQKPAFLMPFYAKFNAKWYKHLQYLHDYNKFSDFRTKMAISRNVILKAKHVETIYR